MLVLVISNLSIHLLREDRNCFSFELVSNALWPLNFENCLIAAKDFAYTLNDFG